MLDPIWAEKPETANRVRGRIEAVLDAATVRGFPAGAEAPVHARYVKHYPPDTNAALAWLSRRQPGLWREKQQIDITGTVAHQIAQMTPEQRAQDALDLVQRARQRLAEYRQTIAQEPEE